MKLPFQKSSGEEAFLEDTERRLLEAVKKHPGKTIGAYKNMVDENFLQVKNAMTSLREMGMVRVQGSVYWFPTAKAKGS